MLHMALLHLVLSEFVPVGGYSASGHSARNRSESGPS